MLRRITRLAFLQNNHPTVNRHFIRQFARTPADSNFTRKRATTSPPPKNHISAPHPTINATSSAQDGPNVDLEPNRQWLDYVAAAVFVMVLGHIFYKYYPPLTETVDSFFGIHKKENQQKTSTDEKKNDNSTSDNSTLPKVSNSAAFT